jgi:hypothetical protein
MTRHKPTRKNKRWPGVKPAARALLVSYEHLLLCVKGVRQSKRLMRRYRALQVEKAKAARRNPQRTART